MNQILSTSIPMDNKKKQTNKTHNPIEIEKILKFFGIVILIFGIFLIGIGVYKITQNQVQQKAENTEPTISIENKTENTILLKIINQLI